MSTVLDAAPIERGIRMTLEERKSKMEKTVWVIMRFVDWHLTVNALETLLINTRDDDEHEMMRRHFIDIRDSIKEQAGID